jgi:two-component system CheB/CheR fusion protein
MAEQPTSDGGAAGDQTQAAYALAEETQDQVNPSAAGVPVPVVEQSESRQPTFLVVGIGASAGGLEALSELLKHVPFDHMAFVVVQHLAPHHESALTEVLSRVSKIQVVTAADGMPLQRNHVYVVPPNADLALSHGVLQVTTPARGHGPRLPIDFFFRSLADDQGPCAIGIILSGMGTDGTFGLKAIKAAGGISFVQDPASAKYDSMPRSALANGGADFCLTPREIGDELTRISQDAPTRLLPKRGGSPPDTQESFSKLVALVHAEFGTDLSHYKPATVERRIERRMMVNKIMQLGKYVKYVQSNTEELHDLYGDMLITVTSFFRDPEVFATLTEKVFPRWLEQRKAQASFRVWVPACASGEEAYSLAICLIEFFEQRASGTRIQIFATDIDEESIQHARRGIYAQNIAPDVSPERLSRFFIKKDHHYVVSRRLRDMVVFSKQNVITDAPFSRIDLVTCRNLLIYLKPPTQEKVLRILHYALNPQGTLLLGTSETAGDGPGLFALVDRKNKIYVKKQVASATTLDIGTFGALPDSREVVRPVPAARSPLSLQTLADRKVLEMYGPPGVLVDENLEILHFRGQTGPYLNPGPGAASLSIARLARPELQLEIKKSIRLALAKRAPVTAEVQLRDEGVASAVRLDVVPIQDPETKAEYVLVLFQKLPLRPEAPPLAARESEAGSALAPLEERIRQLEEELAHAKDELHSLIIEKETSNEELQASNEELQSSNEELQSTNEELETSKEEMQSSNEELTTVNEELENRMAELDVANDDLHNFLVGVDNVVVIAGMDLRIRRYTAAAERLFNLVPGDVGRSVSYLDGFLGSSELTKKVTAVMENLTAVDEDLFAGNGRWYCLRITPYQTVDRSIRGAVISLSDIDARKRAAELTRDIGDYAGNFLGAIGHPLLIVDPKLRVVWANEPFYQTFRVSAEETVGNLLPNIGSRQWAEPELRKLLEGAVSTGKPFRDFKIRHRFDEIGDKVMKVGAGRVPVINESVLVLISIEEDTSAQSTGGGSV